MATVQCLSCCAEGEFGRLCATFQWLQAAMVLLLCVQSYQGRNRTTQSRCLCDQLQTQLYQIQCPFLPLTPCGTVAESLQHTHMDTSSLSSLDASRLCLGSQWSCGYYEARATLICSAGPIKARKHSPNSQLTISFEIRILCQHAELQKQIIQAAS